MLNDRRKLVLRAVVEEYVSTAQPVGSRTLVERYGLNCSSATVRSELSALEDSGHLAQPHTSAGRIPTDLGYRSIVDDYLGDESDAGADLSGQTPSTPDSHDPLAAASSLLSEQTRCLGLAAAPSIESATVTRVDLLALTDRRALFVLITDTNQVLNRTIELPQPTTPEELASVERSLNAARRDKQTRDIASLRSALADQSAQRGSTAVARAMETVIDEVLDALREVDSTRLRYRGFASLLAHPEFHDADRLAGLVALLDDGLHMLEAISSTADISPVSVRIGHENTHDGLHDVSVVVSPYWVGGSSGIVGVIGPTRMEYRATIGAVRRTAQRLSDISPKDTPDSIRRED